MLLLHHGGLRRSGRRHSGVLLDAGMLLNTLVLLLLNAWMLLETGMRMTLLLLLVLSKAGCFLFARLH